MTKAEKLKIIEAAVKRFGKLPDLDLRKWITILNTCTELRKLALEKNLDWDQVKDKYSAGECLLCIFARELAGLGVASCRNCLWSRYEHIACFNFQDHMPALCRYEQWLALLELERKLHADNMATHRDGTPE